MQYDLGTSCLMTTTPLVFITRAWLETGRFTSLTPTELSALAVRGADAAEALLILQAQDDRDDAATDGESER